MSSARVKAKAKREARVFFGEDMRVQERLIRLEEGEGEREGTWVFPVAFLAISPHSSCPCPSPIHEAALCVQVPVRICHTLAWTRNHPFSFTLRQCSAAQLKIRSSKYLFIYVLELSFSVLSLRRWTSMREICTCTERYSS